MRPNGLRCSTGCGGRPVSVSVYETDEPIYHSTASGVTSPAEDWARAFAAFVLEPNKLKNSGQYGGTKRYQYVRDQVRSIR